MGDDAGRTQKENLSRNYADPAIAARQRVLVDEQLAAMYERNAPPHFSTVGVVLNRIDREEASAEPAKRLSLLDAACGSAYYSEVIDHFAPNLVEYTGCDYNPGMVALAKECYPGLPVYECDVRKLTMFDAATFDVVLSGATIIHIREWRAALKELARVARRWLVLHRTWVHTDATPTTREIHDAYGQRVWCYTFNEAQLIKQVRDLNFDLVATYPTGEAIRHGAVKTYLFRRAADG